MIGICSTSKHNLLCPVSFLKEGDVGVSGELLLLLVPILGACYPGG